MPYDTVEECNVDQKAECGQRNLAHVTRYKQKMKMNQQKQTHASAYLRR